MEVLAAPCVSLAVLDRIDPVRRIAGAIAAWHDPYGTPMDQAKFEAGLAARRRVLGDEYVDRAFGTADAFNFQFQQIVTEACWGEVWGAAR